MKAVTLVLVTVLLFRWERTASAYVIGTTIAEVGCVILLTVSLLQSGLVRLAGFDWGFLRKDALIRRAAAVV